MRSLAGRGLPLLQRSCPVQHRLRGRPLLRHGVSASASNPGPGNGNGGGAEGPKPSDNRGKKSTPLNGNGESSGMKDLLGTAIPQYLQSEPAHSSKTKKHLSSASQAARRPADDDNAGYKVDYGQLVWEVIRREAERDAKAEPVLTSFLHASILSHNNLDRALAFVLANRMASPTLLATELFELFYSILRDSEEVRFAARCDIIAAMERDPACTSYSQCLLYYKGFHAIQVHRMAHSLWGKGQRVMALALQSRSSEVFAVDIHPGATIGKGILLDHATGVVVGETAVVGDYCSLLQGVTLGGTGKDTGDRHPKIGQGVLVGAYATILGNINIGTGAQIAAGSLVLKPVGPHEMVAGSPAQLVGMVEGGSPALKMNQWQPGAEKCIYDPNDPDCKLPRPVLDDNEMSRVEGKSPPAEKARRSPKEGSSGAQAVARGEEANGANRADAEVPKPSTWPKVFNKGADGDAPDWII
ncbi:unnamed protein product [Pedinophyceae sp. YPF-701]|nr:unnamed protein product [Pedinophyceae sp. YPF-701]